MWSTARRQGKHLLLIPFAWLSPPAAPEARTASTPSDSSVATWSRQRSGHRSARSSATTGTIRHCDANCHCCLRRALPNLSRRQYLEPGYLASYRSIPTPASISPVSAAQSFLHPDFGSNPAYGIPYNVVSATPPGMRSASSMPMRAIPAPIPFRRTQP